MTARHVALLRGINVGGHNRLPMPALKSALEAAGFTNVATYVQSGNVGFDASPDLDLEQTIRDLIKATFDLDVPVITRSQAEIKATIAAQPFTSDPSSWGLTFLSQPPDPARVSALPSQIGDGRWQLIGRDVYLELPGGRYSQTKLQNGWFEAKLGVTATTRNWNTVLALAEL
jgi:uncharacterized protein (DUF1697 family)